MLIRKYLVCIILITSIWKIEVLGEAFSLDGLFDAETIGDASTLETNVLVDWRPVPGNPSLRQKLVEITVCEWWEGQSVRIPVTFIVPSGGAPCSNVLLINMPLALKPATPKGVALELVKEHGVGIVMVGMSTIETMKPSGTLHLGMREQLLRTKDLRYTTAWIWGLSQMRGLTAAIAETDVFRPTKVLATGGSKRGIASAVAGIHDHRFTAIMPIVAPPLGNPGGVYVLGTGSREKDEANRLFLSDVGSGKSELDTSVKGVLEDRANRRANTRVTVEQAKEAGWTEKEMLQANDAVWDASRIVDYLPQLEKRGLEFFYNVGTNDSVTPALLELSKQWADFPINIIPGGQHGGPATAGYTRRVTIQPEVESNLRSFALSHFFGKRAVFETPQVVGLWNELLNSFDVIVRFPDGSEPDSNKFWWSLDKSEPFTLSFEYDSWESISLSQVGKSAYVGRITFTKKPVRLDFLTTHTLKKDGLSWTHSSPYQRFAP